MAKASGIRTRDLKEFELSYDKRHEDIATQTRGEFLRSFPISRLAKITLDEYVIGHKRPTFCAQVEAKTRPWANIQGATSAKFGIYYGKTKTDPKVTYRYARRYANKEEAFRSIKAALLDLVDLGRKQTPDFKKIDDIALSQMFKAKILSLYFPERFLNVCSSEHLEMLGIELGFDDQLPISQYQHLLLKAKQSNPITRNWSNSKFTAFLYKTYVRGDQKKLETVKKPRAKVHRVVDFDQIQAQRGLIGKAAEMFALEWEKQRLEGADLHQLVSRINDRRSQPSYGYDFLSYSSARRPRYIEVKAVARLTGGKGYRFFLSENELSVSNSAQHQSEYYFYLVFFNKEGKPEGLMPMLASELYGKCEIRPSTYTLSFEYGRYPK